MPLRIGLDTSALSSDFKDHAIRGIGRYVYELQRNLAQHADPEISVAAFTQNELLGGALSSVARWLPRGSTLARQQLLLPLRLGLGSKLPFDALHFPAHMDVPMYNNHNFIVTVLDLIPLIFRELYRRSGFSPRYDLARFMETKGIQAASFVICISQNTARDVERLLGVSAERIAVTPLGVDQSLLTQRGSSAERQKIFAELKIDPKVPTLLYVGGIDQRKNVGLMLEAFSELLKHRAQGQQPLPQLLLVGAIENDRQYPALLKKIRQLALESHCHLLGYLPDQKLFQLYANVDLFFFPSLYEGFGLTPLEAMACGCAVASSNSSSMPEVLGDAALYFDPNSVAETSRALISLLDNFELVDQLRHKGRERAKLFTWEKTAETTLEAYRRAGKIFANSSGDLRSRRGLASSIEKL